MARPNAPPRLQDTFGLANRLGQETRAQHQTAPSGGWLVVLRLRAQN
jgi:hypothetical protein